MSHPSHAQLLALWPTRAALARDLGLAYVTVQGWSVRNNIPRARWTDLVRAARKRGFASVTVQALKDGQIRKQSNGKTN